MSISLDWFDGAGGGGGGGATPQWIANGAKVGATSYTSSLAVPYPAGIVADDIMLLMGVACEASSGSPSVLQPSGWGTISTGSMGGAVGSLNAFGVFWKRATGSESGTQALGFGPFGDRFIAIMSLYRGCLASATPYEGAGALADDGTPTSVAVTTTGPNRLVVDAIGCGFANGVVPVALSAPGKTIRCDEWYNDVNPPRRIGLGEVAQAAAGTVAAVNYSGNGNRSRIVSFALIPA